MFRFGFSEENDGGLERYNEADGLEWKKATEEFPTVTEPPKNTSLFICGDLTLLHVVAEDVIKQLPVEDSVVQAELLHSDLLPAKYEGGFKIWECTYDLAQFLLSAPDVKFAGCRVLDLGCGAGLLGMLALRFGANVHFQDYDISVIQSITIPNVLLNAPDKLASCRFFSGDWESFVQLTAPEDLKYDYILTSETIYNSSNYNKLCSVFKTRLKKNGTVYLAAKTYYFGVGGGMRQFEQVLHSHGCFNTEVCWKCSQGVQREILRILPKIEELGKGHGEQLS
ncbi:histidine protein methyltransferase 1 homolog isoform X2 [Anabrus simplex]|uniref:histidine protein methyltransferase 1 homolog isoform X2 n=1 Tax=Anabrus simplex TaxID=316456 RepID=UPI0035A3CA81